MRARWISQNTSPEWPIIGQAIVALWWPPGSYYFVSTIQLGVSALEKLLGEQGIPFVESAAMSEEYITQVFRCDKAGNVKSFDRPLLERQYVGLAEARAGHKATVNLLQQSGSLTLPR